MNKEAFLKADRQTKAEMRITEVETQVTSLTKRLEEVNAVLAHQVNTDDKTLKLIDKLDKAHLTKEEAEQMLRNVKESKPKTLWERLTGQ